MARKGLAVTLYHAVYAIKKHHISSKNHAGASTKIVSRLDWTSSSPFVLAYESNLHLLDVNLGVDLKLSPAAQACKAAIMPQESLA